MVNMNVAYQRPAKSLLKLQEEINQVWPNRQADKGFITGYPSPDNFSGHNPNQLGIVMGYDIGTYVSGSINEPDGRALAEYLRTQANEKFQYLIHDMGTEAEGQRPMIAGNHTGWEWQPYAGTSAHSDHIHVSIVDLYWGDDCGVPASVYDNEDSWGVVERFKGVDPAPVAPQSSTPAQRPAPQGTPPGQYWIVDPGDTLTYIAGQYGLSVDQVMTVNQGIDPNRIVPGQLIDIPDDLLGQPAPAPAPAGPPSCIVENGDTLTGISAQFGVPLETILAVNPGIDPNLIYPGQVIQLR